MNSKTIKSNHAKTKKIFQGDTQITSDNSHKSLSEIKQSNIETINDENLTTLQKIHAILLNCVNLSKKQKLEFCESQRYFMKLYLQKFIKKDGEE
jgi:hypothetical protein